MDDKHILVFIMA